ncbi:hypothetical protein P7K49_014629 [Saguinus oedipus]|uniref:Uncharacterized protein n=1 Tax=Saguinus oedipus TaxID=9490 RepID=A0ABQ9V7G4_SAGOE|nr:hypothetical protein P7K49_014629 [Saguinus oedipus]
MSGNSRSMVVLPALSPGAVLGGPGHVDPTLSAPCTSHADDSRVMQQPALRGQGQPHLQGHHLLYRLPGCGHGYRSHALVLPEDPAG